ncbi:MAG: hypothetical protein U0790_27800 [Isosphaeraceae bacterium]
MTTRRIRRWRLTLLGCALLAGTATWAALPTGDTPEVSDIKERFARQAARITSLEVAYRLESSSELKPAELLALAQYRNQLFLPNDEWTEAFKGEKRYRRQIQPERVQYLSETDDFGLVPPQPTDPRDPAWVRANQKALKDDYDRAIASMKAQEALGVPRRRKKDPGLLDPMERDVTRGFNGRTLWMRRPRGDRTHEVQVWPHKQDANWFGVSAYLSAVGLQPIDPTSRGNSVRQAQALFRLVDWFKNNAYSLEKAEVVDGSTCVVLSGHLNSLRNPSLLAGKLVDRLWLDRDHGLAVRKREMSKDGVVGTRWENSELREVEPGLWLPTIVRVAHFAEDAPPTSRGKPVVTEEIRVQRLELNRVPDSRFDMVAEKGDVIEDLRGRF